MSDLIRREDAIKAVKSCIQDGWYRISPTDACQNIRCLPSADRPQGEWIDRGMRVPSSWVKKCSLCGYETDTWRWCNFCPNCGARMKGADDE